MTAAFDQVAMDLDAGTPLLLASVSEPDAIRVLLIDDGAIDRGFLANELSKQGFAVRTVASLASAPDTVGDADVIVLHCDRAQISGIDLLGKLHQRGFNVPIVLLTGGALPAHECLALDKCPIDVVGKSRASEVLARRLKGAVEAFGRTDQPRAEDGLGGGFLLGLYLALVALSGSATALFMSAGFLVATGSPPA
jgi:DNA-binding NtrC family response regulator